MCVNVDISIHLRLFTWFFQYNYFPTIIFDNLTSQKVSNQYSNYFIFSKVACKVDMHCGYQFFVCPVKEPLAVRRI